MDPARHSPVGTRLRSLRRQRELAIYGLAALSGVSPTTICAAEKWGYIPRSEVRQRIAAALHVDTREIWPEQEPQV
jgi:DNA-binding XRE family transcriptional regulator